MGRKTSRGTTQFSPARAGASLSQRSQMTIARSCHGLPPSVPTKQMLFADAFRAAALSCFFPGVRLPHSHLFAALCKSDFPATAALHSLVETCVSVELRLSYHLFRRLSSKKQWENNYRTQKKGADDPCKRRNHQPEMLIIPPPQCGRRHRGWRTARPPRRRGWS